ncbi:MAG: hypothetical protein E6P95_01970 [Candidatus Moraniibacteriota bacterium]|nr:MAG: hypothetical protein E6P95_01970 [Candidatus Moranbacteria bacterium]
MLNKKGVIAGVLVLAGAMVLWKYVLKPGERDEVMDTTSNQQTQTAPAAVSETPKEATSGMTEQATRTLRVETSYQTPAGTDPVAFSLSVDAAGVITDAKTEVLTEHAISKMRQEAFAAEFPMAVKGKKLSELAALDRVGKSTLTTNAFNQSIDALRAQL